MTPNERAVRDFAALHGVTLILWGVGNPTYEAHVQAVAEPGGYDVRVYPTTAGDVPNAPCCAATVRDGVVYPW